MNDPLAIDVCPNAGLCHHSPYAVVADDGECPECGHQVFQPAAPLVFHRSGVDAAAHCDATYEGRYPL